MTLDLDKLDIKGLDALIARAETAKQQLRERRRQALKAEFERRSASEGFTLDEIVATKAKASRTAKYVHPDDPSLTWSGLGRIPGWLRRLSGEESIERYRVSRDA